MTAETFRPFWDTLLVLTICSARIAGFCALSVFFSSQYLTGTVRRAVIIALSLVLLPMLYPTGIAMLAQTRPIFMLLLMKEVLLGMLLGWTSNFLFYAFQGIGFIIDTQRGASMASLFDPISNSQTSPLGDFFMKFAMMVAILFGGFQWLLYALYASYRTLPIDRIPQWFRPEWTTFFIHAMGTQLLHQIALLVGPVVFILFLSEFGLGLITRFAPQLNVFFLSMPIKSELAMLFFILYLPYLTEYFCKHFEEQNPASALIHFLNG